jgi:hypothetical protein
MRSFESGPSPEQEIQSEAIEQPKFNAGRAPEDERGVFERLRGRAKDVAKVMVLMSTLSFAPGMVKESSAEQRFDQGATVEEVENEQAAEERAINFLERLSHARAPERITHEGQKELMAERAAKVMIQGFAAQEKILASGGSLKEDMKAGVFVTPEDIKRALEQLNKATGEYADRYLGDKDGKVEAEEGNALRKMFTENPGFKALMEMMGQYR